jgi:hypothetical protein
MNDYQEQLDFYFDYCIRLIASHMMRQLLDSFLIIRLTQKFLSMEVNHEN